MKPTIQQIEMSLYRPLLLCLSLLWYGCGGAAKYFGPEPIPSGVAPQFVTLVTRGVSISSIDEDWRLDPDDPLSTPRMVESVMDFSMDGYRQALFFPNTYRVEVSRQDDVFFGVLVFQPVSYSAPAVAST